MKVKIIKKSIKEFDNGGRLNSLFVTFEDSETYNKIVAHLKGKGAEDATIEKFIKPREYKGITNFGFGLNCSSYTFDRVAQFGILEALIDFILTDKGYINAKINIKDRREQILGYEAPEDEVTGWANGNEPAPQYITETTQNEQLSNPFPLPPTEEEDDLPF